MASARLPCAAALFTSCLLVVLTAARSAEAACNETCRRDLARCMATQCAGIGRAACRRRCKPVPIGTLAYALSECRVDAAGFSTTHQALRIRRGVREPITVVEFGPSEPAPAEAQLCRQYGEGRNGAVAVVVGGLQRLGVSPDGSGVVFEVSNTARVVGRGIPLPPEQQGIFFVRADGSGLRRLGPASRDPMFRISPSLTGYLFDVKIAPPMPFSPNGRRITFTDIGPGPGGEEAVQIVVLDLATGERTQVTHLPSGSPPNPETTHGAPLQSFLTAAPSFSDNETVGFLTYVDPDGSNPRHERAFFTVRIDGSGLMRRALPPHVAGEGSQIVQTFEVTKRPVGMASLSVPGTPVNRFPGTSDPILEVFLFQRGQDVLQLTNFGRVDTVAAFLNATRTRAFFRASADPVGKNPSGTCQFFSVRVDGGGLRQVTQFNSGTPARQPACGFYAIFPDCGQVGWIAHDEATGAILFESTCNPLHTTPYGGQVYAMRPDGSGLRQLTDAGGRTENPDGGFTVQLPGPFRYSARRD